MASLSGTFAAVAEVARTGAVATSDWASTTNALVSDNARSTHTDSALIPGFTNWMRFRDWSQRASIPNGASIDGITVVFEVANTGTLDAADFVETSKVCLLVDLVIEETYVPTTNPLTTDWTAADINITFGAANQKWVGNPTYDQVQSANFGVVISAYREKGFELSPIPAIDSVTMTIDYTAVVGRQSFLPTLGVS